VDEPFFDAQHDTSVKGGTKSSEFDMEEDSMPITYMRAKFEDDLMQFFKFSNVKGVWNLAFVDNLASCATFTFNLIIMPAPREPTIYRSPLRRSLNTV